MGLPAKKLAFFALIGAHHSMDHCQKQDAIATTDHYPFGENRFSVV
jgi:hypothetical protein